jgi:hypothetical protein
MSRRPHVPLLLLLLALAVPAHAYVDPGTGSFVLQIIIGSVASAYVAVKMFWGRIRGRSKKQPAPPRE